MIRKPFAVANWKMAMTVADTVTYARTFPDVVGDLATKIDIVICPPFTGLWPLAAALKGSPIQLGAQNLYAGDGVSYTGEVSAELLADAGCKWVLLGHWERRRHFGETDAIVNRKVRAALDAGLRPILLVGEGSDARDCVQESVERQLSRVLAGCEAGEVARTAFTYEPEWTIGRAEPAPPEHVARGAGLMRTWIGEQFGAEVAQAVRIIYGGSVTPEHAPALLAHGDIDGLGAGRKGRQVEAFADITRLIAEVKGLTSSTTAA